MTRFEIQRLYDANADLWTGLEELRKKYDKDVPSQEVDSDRLQRAIDNCKQIEEQLQRMLNDLPVSAGWWQTQEL